VGGGMRGGWRGVAAKMVTLLITGPEESLGSPDREGETELLENCWTRSSGKYSVGIC
jgi:hypothetical protein